MEMRIAHYPPYTSKCYPIEHRLFPHLTRACQGVIFTSVDVVQELMAKATTKTGLEVSVNILNKEYATGRKVAADFKEQMEARSLMPTSHNGITGYLPERSTLVKLFNF